MSPEDVQNHRLLSEWWLMARALTSTGACAMGDELLSGQKLADRHAETLTTILEKMRGAPDARD